MHGIVIKKTMFNFENSESIYMYCTSISPKKKEKDEMSNARHFHAR